MKPFALFLLGLAFIPAIGGGPAQAQALRKFAVGTEPNISNSGLFIGVARGYFKAEGLDIDVQYLGSPENNVLGVVSGSVDAGLTGVTAGFYNIAAKGGLRIIAGVGSERPGFHNVGFVATNAAYDSGFKSPKDMQGRRVSVTTLGGPAHYDIALIARKYGFDISKVTIVPLQTVPNEVAALKGGQIDALAAGSPTPKLVEADGSGHIIGWAGDEAPSQSGVVFARPASITGQHDLVEKFVRAYAKGCADFNAAFDQLDSSGHLVKGPGYDDLIQIVAKAVNLPPDRVAQSLPYVDGQGRIAVYDIQNQISFWKSQGIVDKGADLSKLVDTSFVKGNFLTPN